MAKIAISLPDDMLRDVEKERQANGETRSQFFRRAAIELLKRKREREWDQDYIRAYQEMPETEAEFAGLRSAGLEALAQEPWDDSDRA